MIVFGGCVIVSVLFVVERLERDGELRLEWFDASYCRYGLGLLLVRRGDLIENRSTECVGIDRISTEDSLVVEQRER